MFDALKEMGILGNFNPFGLFKRYRSRGLSDDILEEAITDGVVDAYTRFDSEKYDNFGVFAHYHAKGRILQQFKMKNRSVSYDEFGDANQDDTGDSYVANIPERDVDADDLVMQKICCSFTRTSLRQLICRAFPERPAPTLVLYKKRNRKRDIMIARYCEGLEWEEVAKKLSLKNKQAAQWHDKSAKQILIHFASTPVGQQVALGMLHTEASVDFDLGCAELVVM